MKPDFFDTCVVVEASRLLIDLKKKKKTTKNVHYSKYVGENFLTPIVCC